MRKVATLLLGCVTAVGWPAAPPAGAAPETPARTVQFMANDASWNECPFTGHAFICVDAGEQGKSCFAFFLDAKGKAAVFGPGCNDQGPNGKCANHVATEFYRATAQLPAPWKVSADQAARITAVGAQWNAKPAFTLDAATAMQFANEVAAAAGLSAPPNLPNNTLPAAYVRALAKANPQPAPGAPAPAAAAAAAAHAPR